MKMKQSEYKSIQRQKEANRKVKVRTPYFSFKQCEKCKDYFKKEMMWYYKLALFSWTSKFVYRWYICTDCAKTEMEAFEEFKYLESNLIKINRYYKKRC